MPFRFRLAKVLRHRRRVAEARTRQVAAADRAVQDVMRELAKVATTITGCRADGAAHPGMPLRPHDLQTRMLWLAQLEHQRERLHEALREAHRELARRREHLTEAWRECEVLEKLRARQAAQWASAQRRREITALDEIGQQRSERAQRSKVSG